MEKNFSNIKYYYTLMEEVLTDIFLIKEKGAWGAFKPTQNIYIVLRDPLIITLFASFMRSITITLFIIIHFQNQDFPLSQ